MPRLFKSALALNVLLSASLLSSALTPKVVLTTAAAGESNRKITPAKRPRGESASAVAPTAEGEAVSADSARLARSYGEIPLTFEANRGQADPRVKFLSRGAGYTLQLDARGASLSLRARARADARGDVRLAAGARTARARATTLRVGFVGASPSASAEGLEEVQAKSNYLTGRDRRKWIVGVPNYARVGYRDLYPGVDLVFYGNRGRLEYDFHVAPGADLGRVKLKFGGANEVRLGADGALVLRTHAGEVRQPRPAVYQIRDGEKRSVECVYTLNRAGEVGFRVGAYDRGEPLVIDPVFIYSTYLGGSGSDGGDAIAIDSSGSAYVAGFTDSVNFPVTPDAKQKVYAGPSPAPNIVSGDAFVTKLTPDGSVVVYSTYIGGSGPDKALGIAVDASGDAFVTGQTLSNDFPTTPGAFDTTCGNNGTCGGSAPPDYDVFVLKLNPQGSDLMYSTYLGGSGEEPIQSRINDPDFQRMGIAVDASGNAYVAGSTLSQDFPTTPGAFQTSPGTGFVTKLNPTGAGLVYSTYFPGAEPTAIALDADGNAYITGMSGSSGSGTVPLPIVNAYQPTQGGQFTFDAFAAKLNSTGTGLFFSTFLGGPAGMNTPRNGDDVGYGIGVDSTGNVYVSGMTRSDCFPSGNPYVPPDNSACPGSGRSRAFLAKFSPGGNTLTFSKLLPGGTYTPLSISPSGFLFIATDSIGVYKVSTDGQLLFKTIFAGGLGGVATNADSSVYVTGSTASPDYPTTAGAFQRTFGGGSSDAFVSKLSTAFGEAEFDSATFDVVEGEKNFNVQVDRSGDFTGEFSVDYSTSDGTASSRSDYTPVSGTLHFAPGETSKLIPILVTDDAFGPEGVETFNVTLSNPTNGATLVAPSTTTVRITDNDFQTSPSPVAPPNFVPDFFVRQHYLDFLSRESDSPGLQFWTGEIASCGSDTQCQEVKRVNVSAAFFLSIEFQQTGYLVYRIYKTAYGDATSPNVAGTVPVIRFQEFLPDTQRIGQGVVVGQGNWQAQLEANKQALALAFVRRPAFKARYPSAASATAFVNLLDTNAGGVLNDSEKSELIRELSPNPADDVLRADVLRKVAENATLRQREFNRAFVLMEYYGYLRRNPDDAPDSDFRGWKFWLDKLNQSDGDFIKAEMVKAFINSDEYKHRFGS